MATDTEQELIDTRLVLKLTEKILSSDIVAATTMPQVWTDYIQETTPYIDDIERDFPGVYQDMRRDSRVESNLMVLRMSLINQGISWEPSVGEEDPRFKRAVEYRDLVTRQLDSLDKPFEQYAFESTLALPYGHHVAELRWEPRPGKRPADLSQMWLRDIRSLPHDSFAFAQDQFNRVLVITPNTPARPLPIRGGDVVGTLMDGVIKPRRGFGPGRGTRWKIIDREKFWIQTWQEEFNNPLGRSLLRAAYHPWWFKTQVWHAYLLFLAAYASPSVVAIPPKDVGLLRARAGGMTQDQVLQQVQKIKNNAAGVLPPGWEIKLLQATSDGAVFRSAIDQCNQEITEAILWQLLMTSSQHNMTRSAGEVHQDVFDIGSVFVTGWLAEGCRRGVARKIIAYNYGAQEAEWGTPKPTLGQIGLHNFAKFANSVSVLENSNWWTDSQRRFLDKVMGVPLAKPNEEETRGARVKMESAAAQPAPAQGGAKATGAGTEKRSASRGTQS
jgi:hypothetical protein